MKSKEEKAQRIIVNLVIEIVELSIIDLLINKLEAEYKKQHALENSVEEWMVSNRKLQNNLNKIQQNHYNLKKKHSKCEEQQNKMKDYVVKLENKISSLSEKWSKLSALK